MTTQLRHYGGRMLETDGRVTVELRDPNDNAHRRFQYRLTSDASAIERRVLTSDGSPFVDTGSPWETFDASELQRVRGTYHPILDPLGL